MELLVRVRYICTHHQEFQQWALIGAIVGCKDLYEAITKKKNGFDKDGWEGHIRNSTMSLTTLILCFFISQICFWDHKYVFHLGKVIYHLVKVIFNLFASMFLTLCLNLSNFCMSSHVPQKMSHMASLVYYKIWDFCIFFVLCCILFKFIMFYSKCPKCNTRFFFFV